MYQPIFILGSGRSGTTLLLRLLSSHEDLAWVSAISNRIPFVSALILFSKIGFLRNYKAFQPAGESIHVYHFCGISPGFLPGVEQNRNPATYVEMEKKGRKLSKCFSKHCLYLGKNKIVSKNTSNSMRVEFLLNSFPNAKFVHIHRHPCAVVSSLLKTDFWPELRLWWNGMKTPKSLQKEGKSQVYLAAHHWEKQIGAISNGLTLVPNNQYLELSYESLIGNTDEVVDQIISFLRIDLTSSFRKEIEHLEISESRNEKWRSYLSPHEQSEVFDQIGTTARKYGYEL